MSGPESARTDAAAFRNSLAFRALFVTIGWLGSLCVCVPIELARLRASLDSPAGALGWFANWNLDTTLSLLVSLIFPLVILYRLRGVSLRAIQQQLGKPVGTLVGPRKTVEPATHGLVTVALFAVSFLCSASVGWREIPITDPHNRSADGKTVRFANLPPAYHDEFSYLLQARTFLAGRLAWPPMTIHPELFHQYHVLNEPTTASRYFPLTGAWLAPFVALKFPVPGQWVAGALACVFFFRSLLRLLPFRSAIVGGLLIAVSPGLAVFSNLLLAHHATMLMLSVFLWAFLRLMSSRRIIDAFYAGVFLTLAMLGRPMTAAGFALPFGVWFLTRVLHHLTKRPSSADPTEKFGLRHVMAMGGPILLGFVVLVIMNHSITGQWNRSAYQYYTDTWTPSHRFGFNNALIGQKNAGPKTLAAYDRWATNLTPMKSIENLGNRAIASSQWTLGLAALVFGLTCALPSCIRLTGGSLQIGLVGMSVITLHLVHIPYWYDGIMHWHYVFETAPLLLVLAAVGLCNCAEVLSALRIRSAGRIWMTAIVLAGLLPNWCDAESFWGPSRVSQAVGEQAFSRVRFELFHRLVNSSAVRHPCLILIDERNSDPQLSYVVNPPDLTGDVLVCRYPADSMEINDLSTAFPERSLYVFNPETFQITAMMAVAPSQNSPADAVKDLQP